MTSLSHRVQQPPQISPCSCVAFFQALMCGSEIIVAMEKYLHGQRPWTEYADLILLLRMCSSHKVLDVAGDKADFS